jgi:septal ring factor EnvC (AmiA/AmiB activator)
MKWMIALFLLAPMLAQAVCMVPIVRGKGGANQMDQQIYENCVTQEELEKQQQAQQDVVAKTDQLQRMQDELQKQQRQIQRIQAQLQEQQEQLLQLQRRKQ